MKGRSLTGGGLVVRKAWLGILAVLVAALSLAAACGGGGGGKETSPTPATLPPADEVLSKAVERVGTVKSFHFRLEHENGYSPLPLDLKLRTAEGDIQVPDRMKADLEAEVGGATLKVQIVGIGDEAWMTNPFSREWQPLPAGTSISSIFDPAAGVQAVANSLQDVSVTGVEKVEGENTYVLEGKVDSGVLEAAAPIAEPGLTVVVKLWISTTDYTMREIRLEGPFAPGEPENIVRILYLSKFDESVSIEPPI
jgi:hypothetical protein